MANRGYLCIARDPALYPSVREKTYDSSEQTIAASVSYVPVLWLAGFEPSDVVRDLVQPPRGGDPVPVVGVTTPRDAYLSRLEGGAARLARALGASSSALDEHALLLAEAVRATNAAFDRVSTELEELWALRLEGLEGFERELRDALGGDRDALLRITGWDRAWPIPAANALLVTDGVDSATARSHDRLLGHAHVRGVPWESPLPAEREEPLLVAAILASEYERALELIERGADPDQRSSSGYSALWLAVNRREAVAAALLDRGAKVDDAAVVAAAHKGRRELVQRMLAVGGNARALDGVKGDPALTRACQAPVESEAIAKLLLDAGADPNAGSMTPLMAALATKRESLVLLLLERGARVDAKDSANRDVLWWARFSKRPRLIALIEERVGASRP